MPAPPESATTRRTALVGALAGLGATAGCDLPGAEPAGRPTGTVDRGDTAGAGASAAPQDADADLVAAVLGEVLASSLLVRRVRDRYDPLARALRPLQDLHETHLGALGGSDADRQRARGPRRPLDADGALAGVRRGELRLQRRLADAAVTARSGALARLLASMSAAVAQHLAALDAAPATGRRAAGSRPA